jgi:hypothetical protein
VLPTDEYRKAQERFGADSFTAQPSPQEETSPENDDEPADWWKELMNEPSR